MNPIFKAKLSIAGTYDIEVRHWNDERTSFTSDFYPAIKNKIVNQGLDAYGGVFPTGGYTSIAGSIIVGTNNTPPSATDTQLIAPLAQQQFSSTWTNLSNATAPYMTGGSTTTTFGVGAVVGNIAEIGLGMSKGSFALTDAVFSRALIQVGGSPGTISLTASDQLVVTYTITATYAADTTGSLIVTTDGTPSAPNNFTVRPFNLGNNTNGFQGFGMLIPISIANSSGTIDGHASTATAFVATTSTFLPNASTCDSRSAGAYTPGSFTNTFTAHWNTGHTTFSEVMYAMNLSIMGFQILFANAFGPTNLQTMDFNMSLSWSSAT